MSENTNTSERKIQAPRQILSGYVDFEDVNATETVELLPLTIVDAMIEYANQFNINTKANDTEGAWREKSDLMRLVSVREILNAEMKRVNRELQEFDDRRRDFLLGQKQMLFNLSDKIKDSEH